MRCSWCAPAGFIASLAVHAALILPFLLSRDEPPATVPEESHLVLEMRIFRTEPQAESTPESPPAPQATTNEVSEPVETADPEPVETADPEPVETADPEPRKQQIEPDQQKPHETEPAPEVSREASPKDVTQPKRKPEREKISRKPEPVKEPARKQPPVKSPEASQAAPAASRKQIAKAEASYRNMVRSLIEKKKFYPSRARRNRSTGETQVSFTLQRDGSVMNLRISQSSGVSALDQAAKKAVQKVGRFPPFPKASRRTNWEFTVPLHYRLPR
ncbi:MAG: energy transducer TonB [Chromatiales bacterium]|jgi:protein TonB